MTGENENTEGKKEVSVVVKLMTAGTAASFADLVTFPLDTAKVRLQIQGEKAKDEFKRDGVLRYKGVFGAISTIIKEEGLRSLYNGLTAGLQRQMCFASVRIGMYDTVKAFYQNQFNGENTGAWIDVLTRICAGMSTGVLAVLIAQPTDVVKIRFQAASEQGKRYKSTFEAYKTIYQSEGLQGLWKGMYPNLARNAIVNTSEIVCYDIIKDAILRNKILNDNFICHFTSAAITGFFTTMVSSPVDVIKTRYMNSFPGQYTSAVDCAIKTAKLEGFTAFYKGFTPAFYRLVAWNIVMWVSYEELKLLW